MNNAIARWEARNAGSLLHEELATAEARRTSRIVAFTRVGIMRATLVEAAYRTAVALGIHPTLVRAALIPDPAAKRYKPGLEINKSATVDEEAARRVFAFALKTMHEEWGFDIAYAEHDAHFAPKLAASLPLKESLAAFSARLRAWLGK